MKFSSSPIFLIVCLSFLINPFKAAGVETIPGKQTEQSVEGRKMDKLSLAAYITTVAGIASFFFAPVAGLVLLPAGFIMGFITFLGGKKRFATKRGRGLAIAAVVLGGAFSIFVFASFIAFALFGF